MFDPNVLNAKIAETHINAEDAEEKTNAFESKLLENHEFDKFRICLEDILLKKYQSKKTFK